MKFNQMGMLSTENLKDAEYKDQSRVWCLNVKRWTNAPKSSEYQRIPVNSSSRAVDRSPDFQYFKTTGSKFDVWLPRR